MQVIVSSVGIVFTTLRDDQPQRIQQTQEEASMQGQRPTALIVAMAMAGIVLLTFNLAVAEEKIQPQTRQDLKSRDAERGAHCFEIYCFRAACAEGR